MATKKVKLADVLWDAANVHLENQWYSCHAVYAAVYGVYKYWPSGESEADAFLRSLGCNPEDTGFAEFRCDPEARQGVRYMWLLLAMHVAEDEGIEIEVEA